MFKALLACVFLVSCSGANREQIIKHTNTSTMNNTNHHLDTAYFGGGCFWCVEAVFQRIKGVVSVTSGYSGGSIKNPTYKEVCSGLTGHAEVCRIVYDPSQVSFMTLLKAFFISHDPTTLNRQGNDIGTQYRSVIFYVNDEQKNQALQVIKQLDESGAYSSKIVTEVTPFTAFYEAEDYHQNYYNENGQQPYCQYVIKPKLDKFEKAFTQFLK